MKVLALDDESIALKSLKASIQKANPEAEIIAFSKSKDALNFILENEVDVAFLDINTGEISGIELAKKIKAIHPATNIVFCTGYSEYMSEAFYMHVSGYITKPVTPDKIRAEFENLRHPVEIKIHPDVYFKAFGNFEAYYRGEPIFFERGKTKELLAYLVDRGTMCTNNEIMAAIWEDDNKNSYLRNLIKDLLDTFEKLGCQNVIVRGWGKIGIAKDLIACDYYDYLDGKPEAINNYRGEYMTQYSWAEYTKASIDSE